jgi:hypothetical protein
MSKSNRLNIRLPAAVADYLDGVMDRKGLDRPAAVRRALGIMQAFDAETEAGRYVGATHDREALETVIVTPL